MLTLLSKHSLIDLDIHAVGDLHVDAHHTVEDVGISFGMALKQALADKAGIRRYGSMILPMDETLVTVAVDLGAGLFVSGRQNFHAKCSGLLMRHLLKNFGALFPVLAF